MTIVYRDRVLLNATMYVREVAARRARRSLDVTGHYARPDIFALSINRKPLPPVAFSD